eukprot:scaffold148_cov243-Pinguiococcus_pyrenoidosus.AAC.6
MENSERASVADPLPTATAYVVPPTNRSADRIFLVFLSYPITRAVSGPKRLRGIQSSKCQTGKASSQRKPFCAFLAFP